MDHRLFTKISQLKVGPVITVGTQFGSLVPHNLALGGVTPIFISDEPKVGSNIDRGRTQECVGIVKNTYMSKGRTKRKIKDHLYIMSKHGLKSKLVKKLF